MTIEKATAMKKIQNLRHDALLKILAILDATEAAENEIEGGDGAEAKVWLIEQLNDDE